MTLREWHRFFGASAVVGVVFAFLLAAVGEPMAFFEFALGVTCWYARKHIEKRMENEKD